jgi:hypothetical protein
VIERSGIRAKNRALLALGIVGMLLWACNGKGLRETESISPSYRSPGVIAVVPFFEGHTDAPGQKLARCPQCEGYIAIGEITADARQIVTSLFRQRLVTEQHRLLASGEVARGLAVAGDPALGPGELARRLASEVGADSVLVGWVFRYSERIGSAWAVQRPASVAFVSLLFNGEDGRLLWRGKVDETQQALSQNVLGLSSFVRRGGRWLTAKQLAADGTNRVLMTFPGVQALRR